jgi:REP element-mobilizing transposase RayT
MNPLPGPGHRSLRKGRLSLVGQTYMITTTTAARMPLFTDFELACASARAIAARRAELSVLCWVLMPDHFHALVELNEGFLSQSAASKRERQRR